MAASTTAANNRRLIVPRLGEATMPLHCQNETVTWDFDGLDDAVGILRADDESVAKPVDGLMVIALGI